MNKHFTITINDDTGVRQFNLHKLVKKIVIYGIMFFVFVVLGSFCTIYYLNHNVDKIEKKGIELKKNYKILEQKNISIQNTMLSTQTKLEAKKKELSEVSDSLSEIETMIGLTPADDVPLKQRINITKLNSQEMAVLFKFIPNGSPIKYAGITSKFGYRIHPILHRREFHRGLDMKAKMGTPVYAPADGMTEWAGFHKSSGYGNLIILQHNYGFKTYYGHLKKVMIKSGRFVKKGDLIGYTGNSGMSNGPHLHYEIRFNERAINPFYFVKWNLKNYTTIFKKEKKVPWQSLIKMIHNLKIIQPMQTQR